MDQFAGNKFAGTSIKTARCCQCLGGRSARFRLASASAAIIARVSADVRHIGPRHASPVECLASRANVVQIIGRSMLAQNGPTLEKYEATRLVVEITGKSSLKFLFAVAT